jgi:hypothetical protein
MAPISRIITDTKPNGIYSPDTAVITLLVTAFFVALQKLKGLKLLFKRLRLSLATDRAAWKVDSFSKSEPIAFDRV